jgi:hypothetical protein
VLEGGLTKLVGKGPVATSAGAIGTALGAAITDHVWIAAIALGLIALGRALKLGPAIARDWVDFIVYARQQLGRKEDDRAPGGRR